MNASSRAETPTYLCQTCGHRSGKWMGFCPQCRAPEALVETVPAAGTTGSPEVIAAISDRSVVRDREPVGLAEFDRVLGGGVVPGAVILIGGEPGVGKSTLLLHVADALAGSQGTALVATAEESVHQVQMRSRRIGVSSPGVRIASVHDVDEIVSVAKREQPDVLIVDSIQTVSTLEASGSAGGTSQVRESAARLIGLAKTTGLPIVLIGHVTKDGSIAGPRTLEHMVDVVLYLDGDSDQGFRFLRSIKNRYGSVNEVGVFEMTAAGLAEVTDPSGVLVSRRDESASGTVLFPTVEGKRPLVVEIQALVVPASTDQPRRAVNGIPTNRIHQVIGIVERHAAMPLRFHDIYVSVMGGMRITEPGSDLPVALAIASSYADVPLGGMAAWGELGLTGEVRSVPKGGVRRAEVDRIGVRPVVEPGAPSSTLFEVLFEAGFAASLR
ncbi:MAG: DNA repair protein RadA [Acidimicrobiia bacterium]|nr:DNA repair protein RadA [Acidimicrobiia bacterium]